MEGRTLAIIVIVLIIIAGGWYLLKGAPEGTPAANTQTPAATSTVPSGTTILYSAQGFSPKNVTVPVGATVTFINQGDAGMWVASAPHPTHQGYSGTTRGEHCAAGYSGSAPFDQCSASDSFTFTFTKAGTWTYHNHVSAGDTGAIVVTP
ncbi:TPA: hypothetical protein DIV48_00525 [Candidatus Kaiserbacteria bacterium]|nr:MAG: Plastocyanin [Parcubacteria group bacterium GW2011_GWA1_56_13]KKW45689.1 MAG: Plastocyanin [Parcubacteria group bacterium GW2011_GWB1_57_6]HCR52116.1 hypothetical protein [Candidatus Kaiserbacteria bacterium]